MSCTSVRGVAGFRVGVLVAAMIGAVFWASCVPPTMQRGVDATPASPSPPPIEAASEPVPPTGVAGPSEVAPSTPDAGGPFARIDLDALLPPGRGRDLVFANCDACHSIVCSLRGQRSAGHWEHLKKFHSMPGLSAQDYDTVFAYLTENVSDNNPEPQLPPLLAQQGCGAYSH